MDAAAPGLALHGCHQPFRGAHGPEEPAGQGEGAALQPPARLAVCGHAGGWRGAGGVGGRVAPVLRVPAARRGQRPAARGRQSRAHHR